MSFIWFITNGDFSDSNKLTAWGYHPSSSSYKLYDLTDGKSSYSEDSPNGYVVPVFYLKSGVQIIKGDGTSSNWYEISLSLVS